MNLAHDLATLPTLSVAQLRNRYAEVFGEPTNAGHKGWLVKRIAWRLQANAEGDLSERARQRDHQTLGEQLPQQPRPSRAQRGADRHFALPRRRTREHQISRIHARDQQYGGDGSEQSP